jgi:hypothetical protein
MNNHEPNESIASWNNPPTVYFSKHDSSRNGSTVVYCTVGCRILTIYFVGSAITAENACYTIGYHCAREGRRKKEA